jgi:hypothetical protein
MTVKTIEQDFQEFLTKQGMQDVGPESIRCLRITFYNGYISCIGSTTLMMANEPLPKLSPWFQARIEETVMAAVVDMPTAGNG